MLKKSTAHVAALNKNLHKGIEGHVFGLFEGHIGHRKFTEAIFQ
jgi:hypothetical protein